MPGESEARAAAAVFEKLLVPLILVVVGAVLAFYTGPNVANRWQARQHSFEIKNALVAELSSASATLMSAVQAREFHPAIDKTAYSRTFRTWDVESQALDAKIAAYFKGGEQLAATWRAYVDKMRLYYNLPDQPNDRSPRQQTLRQLLSFTGLNESAAADMLRQHPSNANNNLDYQNAWVALKNGLIARRDQLVSTILRHAISE